MSPRDTISAVVIALLLIGLMVSHRQTQAAEEERSRVATELLFERAQKMDLQAQLVETERRRGDLARWLQARGDTLGAAEEAFAELAREAEALRGHVAVWRELAMDYRSQIEATGEVYYRAESTEALPDSVTWTLDDGLLTGRAVTEPPRAWAFRMDYGVRIEGELVDVVAPDGRLLVTARASDPRVALSFGSVRWDPPPPERYCGWGTKLRWALGGAAAGVVAGGVR
jgi:hypothetical protein